MRRESGSVANPVSRPLRILIESQRIAGSDRMASRRGDTRTNSTRCRKPRVLIALSGFGSDADVGLSTEAGFKLHLVKPVDPDLLIELNEPWACILVTPIHADSRRPCRWQPSAASASVLRERATGHIWFGVYLAGSSQSASELMPDPWLRLRGVIGAPFVQSKHSGRPLGKRRRKQCNGSVNQRRTVNTQREVE